MGTSVPETIHLPIIDTLLFPLMSPDLQDHVHPNFRELSLSILRLIRNTVDPHRRVLIDESHL